MIQRTLGVVVGAIITYLLLWLLVPNGGQYTQQFLTAVVVGGVAAWAWPVVIGFWLGRRAKERREDQIQKEVERQLNEQR